MQGIYNWLLDFCFYGFLDSIVMYLFIIKLFLDKKTEVLNVVKHCLVISFGISAITSLIPISGFSQILMGIYIGIVINKTDKIELFKSVMYGLSSILFVYCFEIIIHNTILNIFDFNSLSINLNNIKRLIIFISCKFIETILIWWCCKMKVLYGGIVRR